MKKRIAIVGIVVIFLFVMLGTLSSHPFVFCDIEIPENSLKAIESQSKGLYSGRLPLVPIFVRVERCFEDTVYYTIYYFPFGTVGMSYREHDGYNIEKPLAGWA